MAETPDSPKSAEAEFEALLSEGKKGSAPPSSAKSAAPRSKKRGNFMMNFMDGIETVFKSVGSKDGPTRKMAILFFLSFVGMFYVAYLGYVDFKNRKGVGDEVDQAAAIGDFLSKQKDSTQVRLTTLKLGSFILELNAVENQKPIPGVVNMAEVEIYVECDSRNTCKMIEDHTPRVRDRIHEILQPMNREDLLSIEGKRRLKENLMKQINDWLSEGEVKNLYFTKLIVD